jgi:DNA-binding MarR family transcriptional regulator
MKEEAIQHVREFNRFYTGIIGLLDEHILDSPYSLPEARVLYELHHQQPCSATDLLKILEMDKGYLSRVLNSFSKKGILSRKRSKDDGRAAVLSLTTKGEKEFKSIDLASAGQLNGLLSSMNNAEIKKLLLYMSEIKRILTGKK